MCLCRRVVAFISSWIAKNKIALLISAGFLILVIGAIALVARSCDDPTPPTPPTPSVAPTPNEVQRVDHRADALDSAVEDATRAATELDEQTKLLNDQKEALDGLVRGSESGFDSTREAIDIFEWINKFRITIDD